MALRHLWIFAIVGLGVVSGAETQTQVSVSLRSFDSFVTIDPTVDDASNINAGDVDGDQDLDLVLVKGRHGAGLIVLLTNDGRGRFESREIARTPDNTYDAPLLDVDRDGDLDLVVTSEDTEAQVAYLNDGQGRFTPSGVWAEARAGTRNATTADVNGDGRADIVLARLTGLENSSSLCLNGGSARFACTRLPTESVARIVPVDLDNDGDLDLVAPRFGVGASIVLINDGRGGFGQSTSFGPPDTDARTAAAGDLNADGFQDLVLGDIRTGVWVYLNRGGGRLDPVGQLVETLRGRRHALEDVAYAISIADLNGDRRPDIVLGNGGSVGRVLFNEGTGRHFRVVSLGDASGQVYDFAVADFDGDGAPDIAAAISGAPSRLYFNRAGRGATEVRVSTEIEPRIPLLFPMPRNASSPVLGAWHGSLRQGEGGVNRGPRLRRGEYYEVEILVERLTPGQVAGRTIYYSSKSVVRCTTVNTLEAADGTGSYRLNEVPDHCDRAGGQVRIRLAEDDRLLMEYLAPDQLTPQLSVMLKRKTGGE